MLLASAGPAAAAGTSLRFFGNGTGDIDRVKIRIDGPARPADVGATDFTLEWWMKALPGDNASTAVTCGANDGWITGNIVFDRDVYGDGDFGDFGVSLSAGRVAFGVSFGATGTTLCGITDVADGAWHHVAVTRRRSDGLLRIFVDGVLDAEGPGQTGANLDVSYRDNRPTAYPNSDPFLVIGAEKHDADAAAYPSFAGWIDEVRLSRVLRYTGSFTRPAQPFVTDGNTAALYHLDEGSGDTIGDASGAPGGPSVGVRRYGGSPPGPQWSSDTPPFSGPPVLALQPIATGLMRPVALTHAGDGSGRLFVTLQEGQIVIIDGGQVLPTPFLDITGLVRCCGEEGLLSVAFHPDYASNGQFYVYYTNEAGNLVIARYLVSADPDVADPGSATILLTIPHPFGNHNGGQLAFGPDGYLYAGTGDGGGGGDPFNNGQNLGSLLGKVLRLDVAGAPPYAIPPDNPFVGTAGARPEIWAWGLRNPWRFSFDRLTGDLFIGDVGQGNIEEIDFQPAASPGGENYGWRLMEGTACFDPTSGCNDGTLTLPILQYTHAEGCSVSGGYRYRGTLLPELAGAYLFGDFCTGQIWRGLQGAGGAWTRAPLLATPYNIPGFGEDQAGELYVLDLGGGVYRMVPDRLLTVTRAGSGTGAVASEPAGVDCGPICTALFDADTVLVLTATPAADSTFAGWSGACSGTGPCEVVASGRRAVTATFNLRPVVRLSSATYTVGESSGSVTITVTRGGSTAGTASVAYATGTGTATAGVDYTPVAGVLSFGNGETTKTFTIPILHDTLDEPNETVPITLQNPSGGTLLGTPASAVLTITDDDVAGTLQFQLGTFATGEGSASATVTVTRTGGSASGVTVAWSTTGTGTAVAGTDFAPASGVLTFDAGVTSRTFVVPLMSDSVVDGLRTVGLQLATPTGGAVLGSAVTAQVSIADDDAGGTVAFSSTSYSAGEGAGTATLTVNRSGGAASGVVVPYQVTGGSATAGADYQLANGTVTFGAGQTSRTITVDILQDGLGEGPETVTVALGQPTGGATLGSPATTTLTIVDDEVVLEFGASVYSVGEGWGSATITVLRSGPTGPTVSVAYETRPGSAGAAGDYLHRSGTLTFLGGETTKTFTVPLVQNTLAEGGEVAMVVLSTPAGGALLGPRRTAALAIADDETGGTLRFGAPTFGVGENQGVATITVLRDGGAAGGVSVQYATVTGGTATPAGGGETGDYQPVSGTLTFDAGVTSRTFTVPIVADSLDETGETVALALSNPTGGATLGSPSTAVLTITDDDTGGVVGFSATSFTVSEALASATITVIRTGGLAGNVTVAYATTGAGSATADQDYTPAAGTIIFGSGETSRTFTVDILPDGLAEGNETVGLALSAPTGGATLGTAAATLTIADDEVSLQFGQASYAGSESAGQATLTVVRGGPTGSTVGVSWATVDGSGSATAGSDYQPRSGVLTFGPGETSKTVTFPVVNDGLVDAGETLTVALTTPTGGALLGPRSSATVTIQDSTVAGVVQFANAGYAVSEGTATASISVTRGGGSAGGVTVEYATITGGTATPGVDYTAVSGVLSFGLGETVKTFTVPIAPDALAESEETVRLQLGPVTGGATLGSPATATLTIIDNDRTGTVEFSAAAYSAGESSPTATITVTRSGNAAGTATVEYATVPGGTAADGEDYDAVAGTLTFGPGITSRTFTVPLRTDDALEGNETVLLALANPAGGGVALGGRTSAVLTIVDDEGAVQLAAPAFSVGEGAGTATITVTRTGGLTARVTVPWSLTPISATPGADYTAVSGTLIFDPGVATRTFGVPILNDSLVEGEEVVLLVLGAPTGPATLGPTPTAELRILDDDAGGTLRFSAAAYGATEGTATVTITVTRSGGVAGGVSVPYATSAGTALPGTDYQDVSGTLVFGPFVTSQSFTVPILNDTLADGSRTVTLTLGAPQGGATLGSPATATLTIADNEPSVRFTSVTYAASEGQVVTVGVVRERAFSGTVTVEYVAGGGTAEAADYGAASGTLTFGPGESFKSFTLPLVNDTLAEGAQTVGLRLQNPAGAVLGTPATATVTIQDDDVGGTIQFEHANLTVHEGGVAQIRVLRSGGAAGAVTVAWGVVAGGSATSGDDYDAPGGTVTFGPGETSRTLTVTIPQDLAPEGTETVRLALSAPAGGAALGPTAALTLWIVDDD